MQAVDTCVLSFKDKCKLLHLIVLLKTESQPKIFFNRVCHKKGTE